MKKSRKYLLFISISLVLILGGLVSVGFWALNSAEGTRVLLKTISLLTPLRIEAREISGRMKDELKMKGLRIRWPQGEIEADAFHLRWQPEDLWNRKLLVREISFAREQASASLEFENAAAQHAQLDKLKPVLGALPEIVGRIDRLSAVMVQASAVPGSVTFFRIDAACIAGPINFSIQPAEHTKSQSMESRVEQTLAEHVPTAGTTLKRMEHLALLKRWYYRGTRVGEIFLTDAKGALPMRRLVRGISRVYRGEKPESAQNSSPGAVDAKQPEIQPRQISS